MTKQPVRGFVESEFESRLYRCQKQLFEEQLDAIVLTTEPHVRYFSGFLTQFWQSPTRPWFLVVPACGKPIAIIPEIGVSGMRNTWIDDIRSWAAPDPLDDGVSLLSSTCHSLAKRFGKIGFTLGLQSNIRMPVNDFNRFINRMSHVKIVDIALMMHQLLSVKSPLEIEKIRHICELTSDGFNALPQVMKTGYSQRQICNKLKIDLLQRGADDTPYMVAGSGYQGYNSIIMGPTDTSLNHEDILIIDTGSTFDGYFSDFDRNYGFGEVDERSARAYRTLYAATGAGLDTAKPGISMRQLFSSMWSVLEQGGATASDVGRMGHGLGMQLTEWPSITHSETTLLEPGMVITLEPAMSYGENKQMVHEENIVITDSGADLLSKRAWAEIPIIS